MHEFDWNAEYTNKDLPTSTARVYHRLCGMRLGGQ
jgi:hypothetical protein